MTTMENNSNEILPDFMAQLALEKKFAMAKAELFPHLQKIVDAMLEVKGVSYTTADNFDVERAVLWQWVLSQVSE